MLTLYCVPTLTVYQPPNNWGLTLFSEFNCFTLNCKQEWKKNNSVTDSFLENRRMRQEGLFSLCLFCFTYSIDPHAEILGTTSCIQGWKLCSLEKWVSLYVDDMIVYLADHHSSLTNLLSIIDNFVQYTVNLLSSWLMISFKTYYPPRVCLRFQCISPIWAKKFNFPSLGTLIVILSWWSSLLWRKFYTCKNTSLKWYTCLQF